MAATVSGILLTGNHASRPSSGVSTGTLYSCTTHSLVYQTSDTGSTWATWATLGGGYAPGGTDVALADGGTGASLVDPNADRILFWDDSAGAVTWLVPSTGVSISGTNLTASGSSPDCYQTFLTSDVAIPNANTVQDVLSLSLPAGDFLLYGNAEITSAHANQTQLTIALHDGSGIVANAQVLQQAGVGGVSQHASCNARITLAGTTTVKLQAFSVRGSSDSTVKDAATSNGTADKGTSLIALKVTAV